jgi:hypothetical protein
VTQGAAQERLPLPQTRPKPCLYRADARGDPQRERISHEQRAFMASYGLPIKEESSPADGPKPQYPRTPTTPASGG